MQSIQNIWNSFISAESVVVKSPVVALAGAAALLGVTGVIARVLQNRKLKASIEKRYYGKNVIITGASSGIGAQMAIRMAELGARNIVVCARRVDKLNKTAEICRQKFWKNKNISQQVHIVQVDVSNQSDCRALVDRCVNEFFAEQNGRIDLLFLNAGVTSVKQFKDFKDLSVHQKLMQVNYFGCVHPTFFSLPQLLKQKPDAVTGLSAEIAVVSSLAGKIGVKYRTAYSSSKFALLGFFSALRNELADEVATPIQITMHYPGFVLTEIHDKSEGGGSIKRIDMSKFQTAEECVEEMLVAQTKGQFENVMTAGARVLLKLMPLLPQWLIDAVRRRKEAGVKPVADDEQN